MVLAVEHPTIEERVSRGRANRARVPRTSHAQWSTSMRTHRPLDLLAEQAKTRVPELVPIRHGRMAQSPFSYYRGAALPMAADLSSTVHTDLRVQLCGDAHLANFGGFASPEREMLFDLNDFDETLPGPFEWDVKRLAASLEVAARGRGFDPATTSRIVVNGIRSYREAMRSFAAMSNLEAWYARLNVEAEMQRWGADAGRKAVKRVERNLARAVAKDQLQARVKLTHLVDGDLRFLSAPPLLVPIDQLFEDLEASAIQETIHQAIRDYRRTLPGDRRRLLESYRYVDVARKVVGVGSVGTRAYVALFVGRDLEDTLILQVKEAEASVLERFATRSVFSHHGQRVAEGQRLMQAATDVFLGWQRVKQGYDGRPHDYYVRQLWDRKFSPEIETMDPQLLSRYSELCGWTLARAHARSGDAVAIASYLGASNTFDAAVATFARSYADQNESDHQALVDAIASGTVEATTGA